MAPRLIPKSKYCRRGGCCRNLPGLEPQHAHQRKLLRLNRVETQSPATATPTSFPSQPPTHIRPLRVHYGEGFAPVALPREEPVAQLEVDGAAPRPLPLQPGDGGRLGGGGGQAVDLGAPLRRVDGHARVCVEGVGGGGAGREGGRVWEEQVAQR